MMATDWITGRLFIGMIVAAFCIMGCQGVTGRPALQVANLRCEYLTDPIGLDIIQPRLSWKVTAEDNTGAVLTQEAYQIQVASSPEQLAAGKADLWDSGPVVSDQSVQVRYQGASLASGRRYWWRVGVKYPGQNWIWSAPGQWQMGLLQWQDWRGAQWLALAKDTRDSADSGRAFKTDTMDKPVIKQAYAAGLFRRNLELLKPVKNATVYICGLGYCELSINGRKVGDHVLDPGQTSYDERAFYVAYEVMDYLQKGANTVGVMLGNGFYGQHIAFAPFLGYGKPCLTALIEIEYEDGSIQTVVTDENWRAETGPVVFDNVYAGETWDARRERSGWNQPGFDDSNWQPPEIIASPTRKLEAQKLAPCRMVRQIEPARVYQGKEGWIIDLGQNIAGWVAIRVQEPAGTRIEIEMAEHLLPDGQTLDHTSTGHFATGVIQRDIYICKGEGPELWQPRFTYHGFRYARVKGLTRQPQPGDFAGVLVHTDLQRDGQFACSNDLLSRQYEVSLWTIVDNLHSIPEDCPHREKCGWLGDAHCTAVTDIYNFDAAQFFTKYMLDIETVLGRGGVTYLEEKATPGIPCNIAPGRRLCQEARVDWGAAIVLIPYYLYLYYGDEDVWQYHYPHMKRWIEHVQRYKKDGIIRNGYGDWCPPGTNAKMECPPELTSTAIYARTLEIMSRFAAARGEDDFAGWCRREYQELGDAFYRDYVRPVAGLDALTCGSQTGMAIALALGIIREEDRAKVGRGLVNDIEILHGGHISTGIHGSRYLYSVLCDLGYEEVAWKLLTRTDYPSLGYVLSRGLTTWPEVMVDWPVDQPFPGGSYNHPMQSGFAAFFHERVGGIVPDETQVGFKQFRLKPYLYRQMESARVSFESVYGTITSHWSCQGDMFVWDIVIPANTSALVSIPPHTGPIEVNGAPVSKNNSPGNETQLAFTGGRYQVRCQLQKQSSNQ